MKLPDGRPPRMELYGHNPFSLRQPAPEQSAVGPRRRRLLGPRPLRQGHPARARQAAQEDDQAVPVGVHDPDGARIASSTSTCRRRPRRRWITSAFSVARQVRNIAGARLGPSVRRAAQRRRDRRQRRADDPRRHAEARLRGVQARLSRCRAGARSRRRRTTRLGADARAADPTRRPDPARADGSRRRPRLLPGELPRERLGAARRARHVRAGQPLALGARRSAGHALLDRRRPGQARALRARAGSSTSSSTCAAPRRRTASGRATSSTTRWRASSTSRSASRTASACARTSPTSRTSARRTTTHAIERGFHYADPDVAIQWPDDMALVVSERDLQAPRLAEIAAELPF